MLTWARLRGLWRSPVAHLVRIEGVRGSNPLSSTQVEALGQCWLSEATDVGGADR